MNNHPKMRVLLVVRWPVGGIRSFLRYVFRSFNPSSYALTILAPRDPELEILRADLAEFDVTYRAVSNGESDFRFGLEVLKEIVSSRYDVVHSQGFTAGVCAVVPAYLRGQRHIVTLHDVLDDRVLVGLRGVLRRFALSILVAGVDVIHPVGQFVAGTVNEHLGASRWARVRRKMVVVPNGIETDRFRDVPSRDLRSELGLGEDTFLIGFFGRFMSQKGFRYLVEALGILQQRSTTNGLRPIVLTFGHGGFIREEKAYVKKKGLAGQCMFLPFVANIGPTLKGLDVVVVPSLSEASPLLPMEALVAGTPVIGTTVGGLREVLTDTPAVMVPPRNPEELARAIGQEMVTSSKQRFFSFRSEAARRFDVRRQAEVIECLYRRCPLDELRSPTSMSRGERPD